MRRFLFTRNTTYIFLIGMLIYLAISLHKVEERLMLITKPARQFTATLIQNTTPARPDWEIAVSEERTNFVNMISQQPFYWLGKGYQATAFGSADGLFVLKFFHQDRFIEPPFWSHPFAYLFNASFQKRVQDKKLHREEIFTSSKMAFEDFPEESGMLYVHINPTKNLLNTIKVYDGIGQLHRIKPDLTSFVVQRRATYVLPTITRLMEAGHVDEAKVRINQIFELLISMAKRGYIDNDHALVRNNNVGYVKNRAIYIDTGHIVKVAAVDMKERMEYEFNVRLAPLYGWLKITYPELAEYWDKRRVEIVAECSLSTK